MATIITNVTELQAMSGDLTADYELGNDIDASATVGWNGGLGFVAIGTFAAPFTGSFDGKGYSITGLTINRPATDHEGLFGNAIGGPIQNVKLIDVDITGDHSVGALIGRADGMSISNCISTGAVESANATVAYCGGLLGIIASLSDVTVSLCYSTASVTGAKRSVGGLIGYTGGHTHTISQCYATGAVDGDSRIGGLIGAVDGDGSISDCYARGSATAVGALVGGLIGRLSSGEAPTIDNCYATGAVSGASQEGGLVGWNNTAIISNCFWDTETSGQAASDGGTGKTTAELKDIATIQAAGWAVSTIWNVLAGCNNGYPCLINVNICCAAFLGFGPAIVGDKVSLEAIRNLEIVYGGRFYISKSGDAIYESRYHRNV